MIRAVIDGPAIEAELRRAEAATWGPRPDVGAAAGDYIRRGWDVKPVPRREKRCTLKGWPDLVIGPDDLPRYFRDDANIAVRLGRRSGWLVDCDLDCPEALALADLYLPGTGAEFGRMSKPRSHRLYVAPHAVYEPFADPISGDMLVELRADGREGGAHVTLFPPSVADGERREWHGQVIAPAVIDGASILRRRLACLAIGCLSMRYLSEHAAQRPGPDLPRLLWEFDHELGRAAYRWLGQPDPDAPRLYPRPRHQLSDDRLSTWIYCHVLHSDDLSPSIGQSIEDQQALIEGLHPAGRRVRQTRRFNARDLLASRRVPRGDVSEELIGFRRKFHCEPMRLRDLMREHLLALIVSATSIAISRSPVSAIKLIRAMLARAVTMSGTDLIVSTKPAFSSAMSPVGTISPPDPTLIEPSAISK
jgi:hypothetical protein